MNLLVKFPTRSRSVKFDLQLKKYIDYQKTQNVIYLVTLDTDDPQLDNYIRICNKYENVIYTTGYSSGKINAVNRDLYRYNHLEWDILVLASDDMTPVKKGWDSIIINKMEETFPDTDGVLWFSDGFTDLNTMCILGRTYYERFNYIYHPSYVSLWCDNEFQEVSQMLDRTNFISYECIFRHDHFSNNNKIPMDTLMRKNEKYYNLDKINYEKRKSNNFDLKNIDGIWTT